MEIYYDSPGVLKLSIIQNGVLTDADGAVTITITKPDGTALVTAAATTHPGTGKYQYSLTSVQNASLGRHKAVWSYTLASVATTKTEYYQVVVGYFTSDEFRNEHVYLATQTDEEIYRKERLARRVINFHCNQAFDFEKNVSKRIEGRGSNNLQLPRRLWKFTTLTVDGEDLTSSVELLDDYTIQKVFPLDTADIKRDIDFTSKFFRYRNWYYILGDWGWEYPPEGVRQAAMLLAHDYFEDETMLHQHGVKYATIGDVQYTFHNDPWFTTGNYDVDVLISPYVKHGMTLI